MKADEPLMNDNQPAADRQPVAGALYAFLAFLIWGLSPIYWKALHGVSAFEIILHQIQSGAFLHAGTQTDLLLLGTGILTAIPLLLFNLGAKRITLATLGFIQYTAPTGMLLLGVTVFGEPFTRIQAVTFGLIWTGLVIYSWDTVRIHRKRAGNR